ncbi:MAG: hypothetical protein SNH63_02215 [Rikenellaceae bacterium]
MKIESLKAQIEQLRTITDGWREGEAISSLEMDMALDRVKSIYEILRFDGVTPTVVESVVSVVSDAVGDVVDDVVDQIAESAIEMVEQLEADEAEEVIEDVVEQMVDEQLDAVATLNKRERYNRIRSLYGDNEVVAATEEKPAETKPVEVEPVAEVEVEQEVVETVEEQAPIAAPTPIATPTPRPSITTQLTINDRFLLSHDLFNDDMEALNRALVQLDALDSFDDAIIYIAENFSWNSSSGGVQIMITLLKNRFNINAN